MNLRKFLEKLIRFFNIIWNCLNGNQEDDDGNLIVSSIVKAILVKLSVYISGKLILELLEMQFELYGPFNKYSFIVNLLIILEIIGNIMNQKDLLSICILCFVSK